MSQINPWRMENLYDFTKGAKATAISPIEYNRRALGKPQINNFWGSGVFHVTKTKQFKAVSAIKGLSNGKKISKN